MDLWIPPVTKAHRTALSARLRELAPDERQPLLAHARRASYRDWRIYVPLVVSMFAGATAVSLTWKPASVPAIMDDIPAATRLGLALVALVAGMAGLVWSDVARDRLTRQHIAAQFPTLCPTCGYDRRATPDRCPECGASAAVGR